MPSKKPSQPRPDGPRRDRDGEIRHKRSDTRLDTLREAYGADFAKGFRGDMRLGTLLERTGTKFLGEYLKKSKSGPPAKKNHRSETSGSNKQQRLVENTASSQAFAARALNAFARATHKAARRAHAAGLSIPGRINKKRVLVAPDGVTTERSDSE